MLTAFRRAELRITPTMMALPIPLPHLMVVDESAACDGLGVALSDRISLVDFAMRTTDRPAHKRATPPVVAWLVFCFVYNREGCREG